MSKSVKAAVAATINANANPVINSVFTDATRATAKETFAADATAGLQWVALGTAVRSDVKDAKSLDKIRPQVLRELIYQNMPDVTVSGAAYSALAVVDFAIPRKGTDSYNKATVTEKELWAAMQAASATIRGKGSVYYGRIRKYAFATAYVNPEKAEKEKKAAAKKKAKMKPSAKIAGMIGTIIATIQKMESADFELKPVIESLEAAQRAVAAGLPKKSK